MSLILNIDTAVGMASVCLAENEKAIAFKSNPQQKDHAAWLQPAIKEIFAEQQLSLSSLKAVAVSYGPGSYTGLRVGMSAAKGLCYALEIPLITVSSLKMMASTALSEQTDLLCPMIDARRAEVFTAVYDKQLNDVLRPVNKILDSDSFSDLLAQYSISFFGNGSVKFREMLQHPNAFFSTIEANAKHMILLSLDKFQKADFADLAYAEPFYGKDFHSTSVK